MSKQQLKAAVYTRKSTEHGLEQDFNSLMAQREAAEAYIKSQRSEGWVLVDKPYDDGGISGATMERPALQRLLKDVEAGRVDIIIVYKVDRLTRSLSDFARIIDRLDAVQASFVSVTQQFNTSSSMGRLTLNVLLSFAQFEREVTAERIRDKIDASRKKGMWMGGTVPIGYDAVDKKLLVNKQEALVVGAIFRGFIECPNMRSLKERLKQEGHIPFKPNEAKTKNFSFNQGPLYYLLNNRLYIGEVKHNGNFYDGNHEAIISIDLWQQVQAKLEQRRVNRRLQVNSGYPSLLIGLLFDRSGNRYTPSHSNKKGTRYRYYNLPSAKPNHPLGRLPALEIEAAVKTHLIQYIEEGRQSGTYTQETDPFLPSIIHTLKHGTPHEQCTLALKLIEKVQIYEGGMEVWIHKKALSPTGDATNSTTHKLVIKADIKRQVNGTKILVPAGSQVLQAPDQTLIRLIAKARLWASDLESGNFTTMAELAGNNDVDKKDLGKAVRLAYLAPDIITSILEGRQPTSLKANTLRKLSDLPADWDAQRKLLGFI